MGVHSSDSGVPSFSSALSVSFRKKLLKKIFRKKITVLCLLFKIILNEKKILISMPSCKPVA